MNTRQQTVHRYMDGFRRSDHDAILACLTDDVVWRIHGLRTTTGKPEFDDEKLNIGPFHPISQQQQDRRNLFLNAVEDLHHVVDPLNRPKIRQMHQDSFPIGSVPPPENV